MNFYAASNMPVYRAEQDARHKESKSAFGQVSKKSKILGLQSPQRDTAPSPPVRPVTSSEAVQYDTPSIDQLLDPAVQGPPSPESIRELGQRMKRASIHDKHQSHQTTSSGSSSLRSLTSADRPSWENVLDGKTLSRKSSGRSTSSSMPSKERPESVQIFGKTIFSRRGKGRRESSAQSSSSSLYSTDVVGDALPSTQRSAPSRESTIPALFGLRRNTKQEPAAETQRKLNISGPYNFQHVAHTQREDALVLEHGSRSVFASESAQPHGHGGLKGARADEMHFAGFSSDSLPLDEEDALATAAPYEVRQTTSLTRKPSVVKKRSSRRVLSRSQSQEQLRMGVPPPRPPRSPVDQSAPGGPVVPPRGPSRMFGRHERFDSIDRPQTSASFRSQQQYADPGSPPATSYGYTPDMDVIHEHASSTTAMGPRDEANWPLPCPSSNASEHTLPHVPEEEEQLPAHSRKRSRASVASNSSLRGSQSVPLLRGLAARQNGEPTRRTSDASDTLGRFEMLAAQQALRKALIENQDALPREDWEDDIDYCYDHEAEANCDYEWSRPSLETCRDGETATPVDDHGRGGDSSVASPAMLAPGQFDMPALSPASQVSSPTPREAITPTVVNNPKASNFSLPRVDSKNLLHVRKPSDASSFKESHGFTLSPSLLIPMDYQQQMMACEAERDEAPDFSFRHLDEHELSMDPSTLLLRYRTSASTTGTIESSSSAFDKHDSTVSTSTDYTRMTASVSSLEMDNCLPGAEPLQRFPSFESHGMIESKAAMPTLPESEEVIPPPARRPHFKSRGSESNLGALTTDEPWAAKTKAPIPPRRGRARTTSLSTPPPPNQYALFPQVQLSGNRI
ncbi:hypothetical protein MYCTH_2304115 [Thermothelomyces thermophilus ATCC 42464]|uniref:CRIB domain-containing protein n=1 Tax=Thermothelomyces thermophilus (strain ATCC 42464 / BCRC 31852 / DSM 1799) TaxID=573729 RepID=G2QE93_THET4|nr:uncharacterized protein MYCTH_2304115 [Thermothelomyces thermophilus ATCC 42464]AEO57676.1 hypothetical protein MYCTH_2304115 [Thermothelomyces thermophilus ATCC 42464]